MYKDHYDICIIGAGTAGIIAAKKLSGWGYSVLLVEKNLTPRYDHYLSLTPGTLHWLKQLQLDEVILTKAQAPCFNTIRLWNKEDGGNSVKPNHGIYIQRSTFNKLLLFEANENGLHLFQPLVKYKIEQFQNGDWDIDLSNNSTALKTVASFLIEASGMQAIIKSKKNLILPKLIAVCGQFKAKLDCDNCVIEAGPDFWLWGAPSNDSYFVNFFSSPEIYKRYKGSQRFMNHAIQKSKLLHLVTESGRAAMVYTCSSTAYVDNNIISSRHIKIGDSAYCFDPIASQGIQKAIKSAIHGAAVVNTLLSKKDNKNIAISYYKRMISEGVFLHQQDAGNIYREQDIYTNSDFWSSRYKTTMIKATDQKLEKISLDDTLIKNEEYHEVESGAFQNNFIEPVTGLERNHNDELFVFLNGIHIKKILSFCDNRTLRDCIGSLKNEFPEIDSPSLLRWLIFNNLLVPAHS